MYYFKATFCNYKYEDYRQETIKVEEQFYKNEKECYTVAMSKAFDLTREYEYLCSVEFLCC